MSQQYSLALARVAAQAERAGERILSEHGLGVSEWRVLEHLAGVGTSTMADAAEGALLTGPTLSRTVDRLVGVGLVHRVADLEDRRRVLIRLTRRGRALRDRLVKPVAEAEVASLTKASPLADDILRLLGPA